MMNVDEFLSSLSGHQTVPAPHCSQECDGVHGGGELCLEAALKYVSQVGCLGRARAVLDILEQALADGRLHPQSPE